MGPVYVHDPREPTSYVPYHWHEESGGECAWVSGAEVLCRALGAGG